MKTYDKVERIKSLIGNEELDVSESLLVKCAVHTRVYLALTKLLIDNDLTDLSKEEAEDTLKSIDSSLAQMPSSVEDTFQELLGTMKKVVDYDKDFMVYKRLLSSIVISMERMILEEFEEYVSALPLAEQERLRIASSNEESIPTVRASNS